MQSKIISTPYCHSVRHRVTGHYDNRTQQRRPARGQYGHRGGRYGRHNVRHRETDLTDDRCPRQERPRADRGSEETARFVCQLILAFSLTFPIFVRLTGG